MEKQPVISNDPWGINARMAALGIRAADLARAAGVPHQRVEDLTRMTKTGRIPSSPKYRGPILQALEALERAQSGNLSAPLSLPPTRRQIDAEKGQTVVFPTETEGAATRIVGKAYAYARVPATVENVDGVFGVLLRDNMMSPMYRSGDVLILNPAGAPQPGSGVALIGDDGRSMILREFVDDEDSHFRLRRYGRDPADERIAKSPGQKVHVVVAVYPGR